jgi:hypothetical protein
VKLLVICIEAIETYHEIRPLTAKRRGDAMTTSIADCHPRKPHQHSGDFVLHQKAMVQALLRGCHVGVAANRQWGLVGVGVGRYVQRMRRVSVVH